MAKRMLVTLGAVAVFLVGIGSVKFVQIRTAVAQAASFQPPPEAVTTVLATQEQWPASLVTIGTLTAVHGVTVSADLPGIVDRIGFESGRTVQAGSVLVELNTRQERAQLAAAEAQLELARLDLERKRGLLELGIASQAEYDQADAERKQAGARVGEMRATIERKTIRAPFTGILGIRQVNLGQYLSAGDPVVPLQSLDPIYVSFGVPQQDVARVRVGGEVQLALEGATGAPFVGKITAIDSIVDSATRNVQVQATLQNGGGRLRPGMFVEARVMLGMSAAVVSLPTSAISYAPYGDSVFIVGNVAGPSGQSYRGVRQQIVKLGGARGDQVAVLSGVNAGDEVVSSGAFKLRNGAAVRVHNEVQPGNDPAPRPEDN